MADIPTEIETLDIEKKFMNRTEEILTVKRLGAMYDIEGKVLTLEKAIEAVTVFNPFKVHVEPVKCGNCGRLLSPDALVGGQICYVCCQDEKYKKQTHSIFKAKHSIHATLVNRETGEKFNVTAETCNHPWKTAKGNDYGPCLGFGPKYFDVVNIKI